MNQSLLLIKPNAIRKNKIGAILAEIEEIGCTIKNIRMMTFSLDQAQEFYAVHKGKEFFERHITFITSGPIVAAVLECENCIEYVRNFIGNTDPAKAAEGTIRKLFGDTLTKNAVHASDSDENARREIRLIFNTYL